MDQHHEKQEQLRIQRLEMLADVWGRIYLFHPSIVRSEINIDWYRTLIEVIPRVENAEDTEELVGVLNDIFLKPLNDPFTLALRSEESNSSAEHRTQQKLSYKRLTDSLGHISISNPMIAEDPNSLNEFQEAVKDMESAEALILDLRCHGNMPFSSYYDVFLHFFVDVPIHTGSRLSRVRQGWSETEGGGVYDQRWDIQNGVVLDPIQKVERLANRHTKTELEKLVTVRKPTVFIVNNASCFHLYHSLDALQAKPEFAVIWEKKGRLATSGIGMLKYPEGVEVYLNSELLISHTNELGFKPDFTTEDPISEVELPELARRILVNKSQKANSEGSPLSYQMQFPLPDSVSTEPITRGKRLLGLFKIWNVLKYFYPHLEFVDIVWAEMLKEWIPRVESTESLKDYYLSIENLAAKLNDSHVRVSHESIRGPSSGFLPVRLARVEEKVVVVEVKRESPVKLGDEILEMNGKTTQEIEDLWRSRISASTKQAFYRDVYRSCLAGEIDKEVRLTVRREGTIKTISIKRRGFDPPKAREGSKRLPQKIGYINLEVISNNEALDEAFDNLKDTDGLILDVRGYPNLFVQVEVISRVCDRPVRSMIWEIPLVRNPGWPLEWLETTWSKGQALVEPHERMNYANPIVALIDERTQSKAEDFCIYLTNARRATFVGSGTAGTDGDVTLLQLPEGGVFRFTGMRVLFDDGKRFQNIGIVPDVQATPTVQGIIEGRDEVLEKGIEALRELIQKNLK